MQRAGESAPRQMTAARRRKLTFIRILLDPRHWDAPLAHIAMAKLLGSSTATRSHAVISFIPPATSSATRAFTRYGRPMLRGRRTRRGLHAAVKGCVGDGGTGGIGREQL